MCVNPRVNDEYRRYVDLTDEEICKLAQEQDDHLAVDYLVDKYKNFVRAKARSYFLIGADKEDIIQEGMIGLYKATRDFKGDRLASLKPLPNYVLPGKLLQPLKRRLGRSTFRSIPIFR